MHSTETINVFLMFYDESNTKSYHYFILSVMLIMIMIKSRPSTQNGVDK